MLPSPNVDPEILNLVEEYPWYQIDLLWTEMEV